MILRRCVPSFLLLAAALFCPPDTAAQQVSPRLVTAVRAATPPDIDGRFDDPVWASAPPASGFLQRDPAEGQPATEETLIRLAYDDHALYVAADLRDRELGGIVRQLSRRDVSSTPTRFRSTSTRTTIA